MTFQDRIDRFKEWLRGPGQELAETTADKYCRYVKYYQEETGREPTFATEEELERWRESIETYEDEEGEQEAKPRTINVKVSALKKYYEFLHDTGQRANNPSDALARSKLKKRLRHSNIEEVIQSINALIAYLEGLEDYLALRDLALVQVLYGSGLRREEAARLRLRNVESRDLLRIVGKGDKERLTPIMEREYRTLRDWVLAFHGDDESDKLIKSLDKDAAFTDICNRKPDAPVFVASNRTPVPELDDPGNWVYRVIKRRAKEIGVTLRPHLFRHSWVTELLNNGADVEQVRDAAGHEDIRTTQDYNTVLPATIRGLKNNHSLNQIV